MAPDRITHENVLYVVGDHSRRLENVELRIQDVNVIVRDVRQCRDDMVGLRGEMDALRKALYTFALSVAGSALIFAVTLFAVNR